MERGYLTTSIEGWTIYPDELVVRWVTIYNLWSYEITVPDKYTWETSVNKMHMTRASDS